jgi:gliding motility-associated-like protein
MRKVPLLLLVCLMVSKLSATHIVGGEIMYKYLSSSGNSSRYRVTLFLYIDCDNGKPEAIESDKQGFINVFAYDPQGNTYTQYYNGISYFSLLNARTGPTKVSATHYQCVKTTPNACVDKYVYTLDISIPDNVGGYTLSFERCCRNNTINNIINPESTGATYWTHIPGRKSIKVDNSPVFKSLPPNFLCTNAPLKFDHSASDDDGDSLTYELYNPYTGATMDDPLPAATTATNPKNLSLVMWNGYSTFNQIDGDPILSIDNQTGKLTLTPTKTGQFVIGIKVNEYRNGVKIGETKRDFQFNVSNCVFDIVSSFSVPKLNCSGNEVSFSNRSENGSEYLWDFGDASNPADTSTLKDPTYYYKKPGTYNVKLITTNNICRDTSEYSIIVKQNFKVQVPADTLICGSFTKTLSTNTLSGTKQYRWSTGETTPSIKVNKGGKYWVSVTDAPCTAKDTIIITNDISVVDLGPDSVICRDSFVQFTWEGKPGYRTYLWNDSTTDQSVFISHLGRYWVNVTNKNDCPSVDSITFVLYPPPKVRIHDTLFCKGTSVELDGVNYSMKTKLETNYLWNTGEITPQITTFTPGLYIVKLRNRLCTVFDTALLTHIETGLDLGLDTFYCGPVDRWLRPVKGFIKYRWFDNAEVVDYHATTPGQKKLTITTKEGCVESDSVMISQYPPIDGGLGKDTTICLSSLLELTATDSMTNYLWSTGATSRSIAIMDSGIYIVTVKDKNGCIVSDTIRIREQSDALPIDLFMPNAFSPNGDFLNEVYPGNHYKDPGSPYLFRIYNRWGEKLFEADKPSIQWDGNIKGNMASQDVYVYYVRYVGCDEIERSFRGTFTLIR